LRNNLSLFDLKDRKGGSYYQRGKKPLLIRRVESRSSNQLGRRKNAWIFADTNPSSPSVAEIGRARPAFGGKKFV